MRLNTVKKSINGSRVHLFGVAYKKDVSDVRESPALDILEVLTKRGAVVSYTDPYVAHARASRRRVVEPAVRIGVGVALRLRDRVDRSRYVRLRTHRGHGAHRRYAERDQETRTKCVFDLIEVNRPKKSISHASRTVARVCSFKKTATRAIFFVLLCTKKFSRLTASVRHFMASPFWLARLDTHSD